MGAYPQQPNHTRDAFTPPSLCPPQNPPGSGSGAYGAAFDRVVLPALDAFKPQLILVSSGFDASFYDPLAAQMCMSEDYRCGALV